MIRIIILILLTNTYLFSQNNLVESDTSKTLVKLNPKKAATLSAILPGLGQIYNKQYWKVPVIYGGYIVIGHYIKFNNEMYFEFKNALLMEVDGIESTINPFPNFSESLLERNMEFWRRNRDLLIIFSGVYYLLNIVDAHVFAHLNEFNINENISMKIKPSLKQINNSNIVGISVKFNF